MCLPSNTSHSAQFFRRSFSGDPKKATPAGINLANRGGFSAAILLQGIQNPNSDCGMLDLTEKYRLEYVEVTNLRRHYSVLRAGLSTFCMTASLAAFAGYFSQTLRPLFLAFVGIFMLLAAAIAWVVFSYRFEKATLYLRELWVWFDGTNQNAPPRFDDFAASLHEVTTQMLRDKMNWVMLAGFLVIAGAFLKLV